MSKVYVVRQTQEDAGYKDYVFAVFSTEEKAQKCCDYYNAEYKDEENHYYEVDMIPIDEDLYAI